MPDEWSDVVRKALSFLRGIDLYTVGNDLQGAYFSAERLLQSADGCQSEAERRAVVRRLAGCLFDAETHGNHCNIIWRANRYLDRLDRAAEDAAWQDKLRGGI